MVKKDLTLIKEGLAEFYIYNIDKESIPSKSMNVFYNQRMVINRDISILAINAYAALYKQDELSIIESMAASGVSAIRMLKECKKIKKIVINDINPKAVKLINKNIKLNNLKRSHIQIEVKNKDANLLFTEIACEKQKKPNIISIDPFGTPNLYLDSALKSVQKVNGLICITATDTAVLFGVRPNACIRKYLAKPLHTEYCKEIGSRILICYISLIANINKMGIIPVLTFYSGHFIRVFCISFKDKRKITQSFKNIGYVLHCTHCGYRHSYTDNILKLPKKCPMCYKAESLDYAGPLWVDNIHDTKFLEMILLLNKNSNSPNKKKIGKLLNFALNENEMPISYYNIHKLCQTLNLSTVPKIESIINRVNELGYRCSRTHFDSLSIKSDLDFPTIKDVLVGLQK